VSLGGSSSAPGLLDGTVVADAKVTPSVDATVSLGASLAGSDWFSGTGALVSSSGSCALAQTAVGTSACAVPTPVVFRSAGTATLSTPSGLAQTSTHAASAAASGPLSVTQSCVPRVYDGKSAAAPTGGYLNNGQWDFYAYNLGCGAADSDEWGYAYGIGTPEPPFDPPYDTATEAYLTDVIGVVGSDGFGEWHPEIATDPGSGIKLRFFGRATGQSPSFYVSADELATQVQWLSGDNIIDVNGSRLDGPTTPQSITFPSFASVRDTTVSLAATASSGLGVSYALRAGDACTLVGNQLTFPSTAGVSCRVTASQSGSGSFAAASSVSRTVTVARTPQVITFVRPPSVFYVGQTVLFTPVEISASSALSVSVSVSTPAVCSLDASTVPLTVTMLAAGTCRVTAAQGGDAEYAPARSQTWSVSVRKVPQSIVFDRPTGSNEHPAGPITVGDTVELTSAQVSASSGLAVSLVASGGCSISGSSLPATVTFVDGTSCTLTASQGGDDTYAAAGSQRWSLRAKKLAQAIDFVQPVTPRPVSSAVDLSGVTAGSGLGVSFTVTSGTCVVNGLSVEAVGPGACTIRAAQVGDDVWAAAPSVARSVTFQ
jgi:hypothetical protein